jgi:hypothetical protein
MWVVSLLFATKYCPRWQKIKGWLGWQKGKVVKPNPWTDWLKRLRAPTAAAPRKLADYQYYMQHPDYKDQISAIFEERKVAVTDKKKHISLQVEIACEMFAAEPEEVHQRIAKGATAEHAALLAKHKNTLEGLPVLDEAGTEE